MESTLRIGGKDIRIRSSLKTIIDYKNTFGTDLFADIERLGRSNDSLSDVVNVIFQLLYVLHKPYEDGSYEQFLDGFDFGVISDADALKEVVDTFTGLFQKEADARQD
jgi:hypothetical protein